MSYRFRASTTIYGAAVFLSLAYALFFGVAAGCSVDSSTDTSLSGKSDPEGRDAGGGGGVVDAAGDVAVNEAGEFDAGEIPGGEAGIGDSAPGAGGDGEGGCVEDPTDAACGNGAVDEGEQCDDGKNGDQNDGCRDECVYSCGEAALDCDDQPGDCQHPVCVTVTAGAVCGSEMDETDLPDDGNICTWDFCDGFLPGHSDQTNGYPCENSSGTTGDYCRQGACIDPECGDGVRGPLEQCDDGANLSGDGCSASCILEHCGDGKPDGGEDCDDGAGGDEDDGCDDMCHFSCSIPELDCSADVAGDCAVPACQANEVGQVCGAQADLEDLPVDGNPCTDDLCDPEPGNPPVEDGTACDNQQGRVGDYCYEGECTDSACGDQVVGPLEGCDDADTDPCDGCLPNCKPREEFCGNGYVCPPEQCDDGNTDSGDGCSATCQSESADCPPEMVYIPADPGLGVDQAFCMDRFEASRQDATFTSMGSNTTMALSKPNVIPWSTNPMSATVLSTYQAACSAAGKYICRKEQWYSGCTGPDRNVYVFGNTFDPEICNCVATFCDDYCLDYGIELQSCNTDVDGCGYHCGTAIPVTSVVCLHVEPTGQFRDCRNEFGVRDLCGNVWEIVPSQDDARGYEIRGGAFNCAYPSGTPSPPYGRLQCTFNASWTSLNAGFRCCADIE